MERETMIVKSGILFVSLLGFSTIVYMVSADDKQVGRDYSDVRDASYERITVAKEVYGNVLKQTAQPTPSDVIADLFDHLLERIQSKVWRRQDYPFEVAATARPFFDIAPPTAFLSALVPKLNGSIEEEWLSRFLIKTNPGILKIESLPDDSMFACLEVAYYFSEVPPDPNEIKGGGVVLIKLVEEVSLDVAINTLMVARQWRQNPEPFHQIDQWAKVHQLVRSAGVFIEQNHIDINDLHASAPLARDAVEWLSSHPDWELRWYCGRILSRISKDRFVEIREILTQDEVELVRESLMDQ